MNKNIEAHILLNMEMLKIGFIEYPKNYWYFYKDLYEYATLTVIIPKNGSDIEILILNDDRGLYYDFQEYLKKGV